MIAAIFLDVYNISILNTNARVSFFKLYTSVRDIFPIDPGLIGFSKGFHEVWNIF